MFGQETRSTVEILGPIFNGINKKGSDQTIWEELDSIDFYLDADYIVDYKVEK